MVIPERTIRLRYVMVDAVKLVKLYKSNYLYELKKRKPRFSKSFISSAQSKCNIEIINSKFYQYPGVEILGQSGPPRVPRNIRRRHPHGEGLRPRYLPAGRDGVHVQIDIDCHRAAASPPTAAISATPVAGCGKHQQTKRTGRTVFQAEP